MFDKEDRVCMYRFLIEETCTGGKAERIHMMSSGEGREALGVPLRVGWLGLGAVCLSEANGFGVRWGVIQLTSVYIPLSQVLLLKFTALNGM